MIDRSSLTVRNSHSIEVQTTTWRSLVDALVVIDVIRFLVYNFCTPAGVNALGGGSTFIIVEAIVTVVLTIDAIEWVRFIGFHNIIMVYRMEERV